MIFIRLFFFIFLIIGCTGNRIYQKSDHYSPESQLFNNPTVSDSGKGFISFLHWKLFTNAKTWPTWVDLSDSPILKKPTTPNKTNITFINHSTFLLQFDQINVLTDPVWSQRVSPVSWAGPKRVHPPGIPFDKLPQIDVVILSHNHYDHMDKKTLIRLEERHSPVFICPLGDGAFLEGLGLKKVFELDWWQKLEFNTMEISFTPTQHWSKRTLFDTNESLWGSFVIKYNKKKVYFGGDTGYSSHFKEIQKRFGHMDLSLLPIGAYAPRWFMQTMHMDPEEAIWAHKDLKSRKSIGIHYGSFQLTNESRDEPVHRLQMYLKSNQLKKEDFLTLNPGESRMISL
jgi:L-ascorbate metabolism protein UlaG (beta-lactamase superfamily)